MKTLTTLTAGAALAIGLSTASAQNAPSNPPQNSSPNQINKSNLATKNSGSESQSTAKTGSGMTANKQAKTIGSGKFCVETTPGGALNCKFTTMAACQKEGQANNRQCFPNPKSSTTGSK
jgi:hypothetical protein